MKNLKSLILVLAGLSAVFSAVSAQPLWWRVYDSLGNSALEDVVETDSWYIHTGGTFNVPGGACYLAATDKETGFLKWWRYFPSTTREQSWGEDLVRTPDGGLAVLSTDWFVPPYNNLGFWLIKTDIRGETLWTRKIAPRGLALFPPFFLDLWKSDSGYVLAAKVKDSAQLVVVRTNSNGDTLWSRIIPRIEPFPGTFYIEGLLTTTNRIYVLGDLDVRAYPNGPFIWKGRLVEMNENGEISWRKEYGDSSNMNVYLSSFSRTPDGFLLAGIRYRSSEDSIYLIVIKTDTAGNEQWRKSIGLKNLNGALKEVNPERMWKEGERIIILLDLKDSLDYIFPGILITDSQGNPLDLRSYPHPEYEQVDVRAGLLIGDTIVMGGTTWLHGYPTPAYLMKVVLPPPGIEEKTASFGSSSGSIIRIFPNPSSGIINLQIPNGKHERVQIFDVNGRLVLETEISHQLRLRLPVGIYFFKNSKIVILGQN